MLNLCLRIGQLSDKSTNGYPLSPCHLGIRLPASIQSTQIKAYRLVSAALISQNAALEGFSCTDHQYWPIWNW